MLKTTLTTIAIALLAAVSAQACDNTKWLKRWAQAHHSDIAAAAQFLETHPEKAKRLDEKCMHAKRKKKHKKPHATPTPAPTPTPVRPTPVPTPTSTPVPIPTPVPTETPTPTPGCVFSGRFRCDITLWCFETVKLGNVTYTKEQAFQIFATQNNPQNVDALLHLVKNLLQVKLNLMCNHSPPECIAGTVANADFVIGNHISPPFGALGQLPKGSENNLVAIMHAYNGAQLCAEACSDEVLTCPDP